MLSNGIRLEILTNANRLDDVDVLLNELKSIKDKNFLCLLYFGQA